MKAREIIKDMIENKANSSVVLIMLDFFFRLNFIEEIEYKAFLVELGLSPDLIININDHLQNLVNCFNEVDNLDKFRVYDLLEEYKFMGIITQATMDKTMADINAL